MRRIFDLLAALACLVLSALALEHDINAMRFRSKYVSASQNGDYCQAAFENTDPADDEADVDGPDRPYSVIQRQFEGPDGGRFYGERRYPGSLSVRIQKMPGFRHAPE